LSQYLEVACPTVERFLSLGQELMALIHGCDARDRATLMVEDLVSHVRRNPEPGHTGHHRPPQVMQRPIRNAGQPIEPSFAFD
jgi:hypothetical protein